MTYPSEAAEAVVRHRAESAEHFRDRDREEVRPRGAVDLAVDVLAREVERAAKIAGMLADRLGPVLLPDEGVAVAGAADEPERSTAPLAGHLASLTDALSSVLYRLENVERRVAL